VYSLRLHYQHGTCHIGREAHKTDREGTHFSEVGGSFAYVLLHYDMHDTLGGFQMLGSVAMCNQLSSTIAT
jgi:hypothetical protein